MSKTLKIRDNIEVPQKKIEEFCLKWGITSLELFGSVLRDDFTEACDIDFLFSYDRDVRIPSLFYLAEMKEELEKICQRKIDFVSKRGIESSRNKLRKKEILDSARVFYVKTP